MAEKILSMFDNSKTIEQLSIQNYTKRKTDIRVYNLDTGETIFRGSNKVNVAGAGFTARGHFDLPRTEITPSYNSVLNLENSVIEQPTSLEKVFLFAVGKGGCGAENSQVYEVDYKKWISVDDLIPFRYPLSSNDLDVTARKKYFGRKVLGDRIAYYFKAFESAPVFTQQYIDGTPIDSNIYWSTKPEEVESFIDLKLRITKEDCRDFFIETTGINSAKVNSISLLTAWAKNFNGYTYYQDIRPLTVYNMVNEPLIELTKGIGIDYQIFY